MKRRPLIAGNWKMYNTGKEAIKTIKTLTSLLDNSEDIEIMIAPTFLALPLVSFEIQDEKIKLGAQNLHFENQGAFTGEVSAKMIKEAGAKYVIIGHSERRQYFNETDIYVQKKINAAIRYDLKPILCVGETEKQRDAKKTFSTLDKQIIKGLQNFDSKMLEGLVIAYEPVWAIGTGKTATTLIVDQVHQYLRSLLEKMFSKNFASKTRILYGGSVKPENIKSLMALENVDGALVGGASLDPNTFIKIIKYKN